AGLGRWTLRTGDARSDARASCDRRADAVRSAFRTGPLRSDYRPGRHARPADPDGGRAAVPAPPCFWRNGERAPVYPRQRHVAGREHRPRPLLSAIPASVTAVIDPWPARL